MMIAGVALVGLILGSFLNVVINRLPEKMSLVRLRSQCPSCKENIRFYDNVPLLSYLILQGHCRHCRQRIPIKYPVVEALTALCLIALYLKFGLSARMLAYGVLTLFLIPISFIDLDKGLILNRLTIPCFILGVPLILGLQIETWKQVLLGAVGGGVIVLLIAGFGKLLFKKDSMGMGDVKLLVIIGVYTGFPDVALCLFYGILVAAIVILGGMILKKLRRGDIIPFGPFIAVGTLVYLLWGEEILQWYAGQL